MSRYKNEREYKSTREDSYRATIRITSNIGVLEEHFCEWETAQKHLYRVYDADIMLCSNGLYRRGDALVTGAWFSFKMYEIINREEERKQILQTFELYKEGKNG